MFAQTPGFDASQKRHSPPLQLYSHVVVLPKKGEGGITHHHNRFGVYLHLFFFLENKPNQRFEVFLFLIIPFSSFPLVQIFF